MLKMKKLSSINHLKTVKDMLLKNKRPLYMINQV